jgi:F-type H+-transporting ATPase subunit b
MLSIDGTALIVFLFVWILVLALYKIFFKPLKKVMDKRESEIGENIAATRRTLSANEENLKKIEESLREARTASARIKESLELEALKEKSRILSELSAEHRDRLDKAREELAGQIERLKKDLDKEAARLADKIEEKLLH